MDIVDKRLVERYGVPRSGKADKRCMSLPTVGEEHYRLFSPLHGDYHTKMMEICCDHKDADSSSWFTRCLLFLVITCVVHVSRSYNHLWYTVVHACSSFILFVYLHVLHVPPLFHVVLYVYMYYINHA